MQIRPADRLIRVCAPGPGRRRAATSGRLIITQLRQASSLRVVGPLEAASDTPPGRAADFDLSAGPALLGHLTRRPDAVGRRTGGSWPPGCSFAYKQQAALSRPLLLLLPLAGNNKWPWNHFIFLQTRAVGGLAEDVGVVQQVAAAHSAVIHSALAGSRSEPQIRSDQTRSHRIRFGPARPDPDHLRQQVARSAGLARALGIRSLGPCEPAPSNCHRATVGQRSCEATRKPPD